VHLVRVRVMVGVRARARGRVRVRHAAVHRPALRAAVVVQLVEGDLLRARARVRARVRVRVWT